MYHLTGDGSVFETTNNGKSVYMARVSLKHETTGKTITVSGVGSTRKQAVQRRDANVARRLHKLDPSTDPATLPVAKTRLRARKRTLTPSQYLPIWHQLQGTKTKPQSKKSQQRRLEKWVFPWLDQPMDTLTKSQIEIHFSSTLPAAGAGPTSVYDAYCAFRALLNSAYSNDYLKRNPAHTLRPEKPEPAVQEEDQRLIKKRLNIFKALLNEIEPPEHPHHEHYPLFLLLSLGLRRAEVCGLEWKNLAGLDDKNKGHISLRQQLIGPQGSYRLQRSLKAGRGEKTTGKRDFPLPERHRLALKELKKKGHVGEGWAKNLILTKEDGSMFDYHDFDQAWRSTLIGYLTKNGRELRDDDYFRPHYARKMAATMLAQAGVPVKTAAAILGHHPTVMLTIYAQVHRDDKSEAINRLGDALSG